MSIFVDVYFFHLMVCKSNETTFLDSLKKVLIIAYFFPPCNMAGAHRPFAWAQYLKEQGLFPIIITRSWQHEISTPMDVLKASGKDIDHEQHETYEVYYLPYEPNLRDRIYSKYGDRRYTLLRKLLSLWELLTQNFNSAVLPYRNLNQFAEQYLLKNPEVTRMIITANPFPLFKFGYLLKNKFNIKWIADYRDDWSTTEIDKPTSTAQRLLARMNSYYERKWVGSSECITSISNYYTNKISAFVNKPGHTIYNGYNELDTATAESSLFQEFTITYCGTLYARQNIELFLDSLKKLIDHADNKLSIKLHLSGISFFDATQTARVHS